MTFEFDETTPDILRNQILAYHMTDVLTDRERARFFGLPEGCRIRERAKILALEKLSMGCNVWIGEGAVLDAQGGLTIGDFTQIGINVMIWSHSSHQQALASNTGISNKDIIYRPTKIGSNVFIAGPSVIAPGVTIGDRVIISPLSFVDRDLPDDSMFSPSRNLQTLQEKVKKIEVALEMILAKGFSPETHPGDMNDV
ncbi:MAG: acyltransferase [Desulfosporosinus sp.]|nr:acyltransferase [Desulfosporosinus sp.]